MTAAAFRKIKRGLLEALDSAQVGDEEIADRLTREQAAQDAIRARVEARRRARVEAEMNPERKPDIVGQTIAVWFSCGAASAVAARETIRLYGARNSVRVLNNPVMEEGWDNRRFLADVEEWIGQKIEIVTHPKWPMASAASVWEKRRYMSGVQGAPCTALLKKEARSYWEEQNHCDWHVMGFHAGETRRHKMFVFGERENVLPVLIDAGLTKERCAQIVVDAGIRLPEAYRWGLPNANCIGCVKASSPTYWNRIREVAPDVFHARCEQSRRIGARLVEVKKERIFLDELAPDVMGAPLKTLRMPECGIFCEGISWREAEEGMEA